jgi:agmatinase
MNRRQSKICWANTSRFEDSDVVIVGIQDESGSHSDWVGTSKAPNKIRAVSNQRDVYHEEEQHLALPTNGLKNTNVFDYGNIDKQNIAKIFNRILSDSKIPITIGGDHSITTPILKALSKKYGKISLVYFDAHPDFVLHTRNYHGSVITDSLDYINIKSSMQIGIRSPEVEELENIRKYGLKVITPFDIIENGPAKTLKTIFDTIGKNTYISFDIDCLDPAYAPGASVPVPIGLKSSDVTYFIKKIAEKGIIGMDIVEICPTHDLNDITSHFASRLIGETISSCKV